MTLMSTQLKLFFNRTVTIGSFNFSDSIMQLEPRYFSCPTFRRYPTWIIQRTITSDKSFKQKERTVYPKVSKRNNQPTVNNRLRTTQTKWLASVPNALPKTHGLSWSRTLWLSYRGPYSAHTILLARNGEQSRAPDGADGFTSLSPLFP